MQNHLTTFHTNLSCIRAMKINRQWEMKCWMFSMFYLCASLFKAIWFNWWGFGWHFGFKSWSLPRKGRHRLDWSSRLWSLSFARLKCMSVHDWLDMLTWLISWMALVRWRIFISLAENQCVIRTFTVTESALEFIIACIMCGILHKMGSFKTYMRGFMFWN